MVDGVGADTIVGGGILSSNFRSTTNTSRNALCRLANSTLGEQETRASPINGCLLFQVHLGGTKDEIISLQKVAREMQPLYLNVRWYIVKRLSM